MLNTTRVALLNDCVRSSDEWEVERSCLTFGDSLGKGAFGQVIKATLSLPANRRLRATSSSSSSGVSSSNSEVDAQQLVVAVKLLLGLFHF